MGDGPYTVVLYSSYDLRAYRLAQKRITLAGSRLAQVLNDELKIESSNFFGKAQLLRLALSCVYHSVAKVMAEKHRMFQRTIGRRFNNRYERISRTLSKRWSYEGDRSVGSSFGFGRTDMALWRRKCRRRRSKSDWGADHIHQGRTE